MIALTYDEVADLDPCADSFKRVVKLLGGKRKWNGHRIDAKAAKEAGCTYDDLVWVASRLARTNADVERRLRLWIADCAARVLHIYEATETSDAPRKAIVARRRFARGEIDAIALAAAWAAAWDAARAAAGDAARAAAGAAAWAAAWDAAWAATWDAAWAATWDATWAAAEDAARAAADAARAAERQWQFDRLIEWLSDDEPEDWPLPERRTHL